MSFASQDPEDVTTQEPVTGSIAAQTTIPTPDTGSAVMASECSESTASADFNTPPGTPSEREESPEVMPALIDSDTMAETAETVEAARHTPPDTSLEELSELVMLALITTGSTAISTPSETPPEEPSEPSEPASVDSDATASTAIQTPSETDVSETPLETPPEEPSRPLEPGQIPCRFFKKGTGYCSRGDMCWYKHEKPDPEPTDDDAPTNPAEPAESANSVEICAICYEVPEKFGLMAGCPHVFCLGKSLSSSICNFELTFDCVDCIRGWRKTVPSMADAFTDTPPQNIKLCPLCRMNTRFIIPTAVWPATPETRKAIEKGYLNRLSKVHCRYFTSSLKPRNFPKDKHGRTGPHHRRKHIPFCPFGNDCHYRHEKDGQPFKFSEAQLGRHMWAMKKIMHFNVEDRSQLDDSSIAAVMVRYYRENHPDSEIIQRIDQQNPEPVPDANNEDPEFYPNFGGAFDFGEQWLLQAAALGDISEDNFDEENEDMVHYLLEEVAAGNGNAGW